MPRRDAATRSPTSMLSTLGFVGGSKVRLLVPTTNCETTAPVLPRFRVNPQALPVTPDHVSVQEETLPLAAARNPRRPAHTAVGARDGRWRTGRITLGCFHKRHRHPLWGPLPV